MNGDIKELVSIITPLYDSEDYIKEAIESVKIKFIKIGK